MNNSGNTTRSAPWAAAVSRASHFFDVAGDVADRRVKLRNGDGQFIGRTGVHRKALPPRRPALQWGACIADPRSPTTGQNGPKW